MLNLSIIVQLLIEPQELFISGYNLLIRSNYCSPPPKYVMQSLKSKTKTKIFASTNFCTIYKIFQYGLHANGSLLMVIPKSFQTSP